nr:putative reverse transcriptase domain, reverse transcriptase zinc-binding domain protein [Tanacetum cinerariifolium]
MTTWAGKKIHYGLLASKGVLQEEAPEKGEAEIHASRVNESVNNDNMDANNDMGFDYNVKENPETVNGANVAIPLSFVKELKLLRKPLRKLLYDHGNIHDNVEKLRHELDEAQKALDFDPNNLDIRMEEVAYLKAFHDALIMEERLLMQRLSIDGYLHGYFKGKRGLRQRDVMSPYLFTLVMEVLTLMLKQSARDSNFSYHRYCSKLNLINLCFVDDLFLFAPGDENSARVIMDSLEEFKNASGLTPSLPKSSAYFYNVLNHVKFGILSVLPFEEGKLPVKYLGVPFVPSRLVYRDCSELMERVKRRINDLKNKVLSFVGRVQLIRSVIGSMHLYQASVFILSSRLLLELENLCGSSGFTLISLMGDHSRKLRYEVHEIIDHGSWSCPNDWASKYPSLVNITVHLLSNEVDLLMWRNLVNLDPNFSVAKLWDCIHPRSNEERNKRLFKKKKCSHDQVIDVIKSNIRLKLVTSRFKKTFFKEANRWAVIAPLLLCHDDLRPYVLSSGSFLLVLFWITTPFNINFHSGVKKHLADIFFEDDFAELSLDNQD